MGRATQGVRLINLKENDIIASVACVLVNEEDRQQMKRSFLKKIILILRKMAKNLMFNK